MESLQVHMFWKPKTPHFTATPLIIKVINSASESAPESAFCLNFPGQRQTTASLFILHTHVDPRMATKTLSRSKSIIQYVQSEITDDQKIGITQCQEAPPSRLAHTFQAERAKKASPGTANLGR